jgi:hypothetical protein
MPQPPWTHTLPSFDDEVEALLSGRAPGSPPSAELHRVATVVAVLTAPAADDEMRGLDGALHAYRVRLGMSLPDAQRRKRRTAVLAGVAAGLVATGGAAAASGSLPEPMQNFAHDIAGAPAAKPQAAVSHPVPQRTAAATATAGSGPAAQQVARLCHAYLDARRHRDTAFSHSRAFGRLIELAGGRDQVAAFCASVPAPPAGHPAGHATHGRPASPGASAHRSGAPPSRPAGPPSTHPSGAHPNHRPSTDAAVRSRTQDIRGPHDR